MEDNPLRHDTFIQERMYLMSAGTKLAPLVLSDWDTRWQRRWNLLGQGLLLLITSLSVLAVFFIFYFIIRDAIPFFQLEGFREFFTSTRWYPSSSPAEFGGLSIFYGTAIVTLGAILVAVPLGVASAVCLSDILPFEVRQWVKPVIEILTSIPSVAYGFFALVVLAPLLQENGGGVLCVLVWLVGLPLALAISLLFSDLLVSRFLPAREGRWTSAEAKSVSLRNLLLPALGFLLLLPLLLLLSALSDLALAVQIASGTNALNVSLILGIMALPTVVSVSEDALQAVGPELRSASYGLGATRAETLLKVVLPAASSGICAAVLLGMMRAVGETMVVWMASGNAARIPDVWYDLTAPVRTLTATIAGDMGEADHVTGSSRYHVLFAMALVLLTVSFLANLISEQIIKRQRRRLGGR